MIDRLVDYDRKGAKRGRRADMKTDRQKDKQT